MQNEGPAAWGEAGGSLTFSSRPTCRAWAGPAAVALGLGVRAGLGLGFSGGVALGPDSPPRTRTAPAFMGLLGQSCHRRRRIRRAGGRFPLQVVADSPKYTAPMIGPMLYSREYRPHKPHRTRQVARTGKIGHFASLGEPPAPPGIPLPAPLPWPLLS